MFRCALFGSTFFTPAITQRCDGNVEKRINEKVLTGRSEGFGCRGGESHPLIEELKNSQLRKTSSRQSNGCVILCHMLSLRSFI